MTEPDSTTLYLDTEEVVKWAEKKIAETQQKENDEDSGNTGEYKLWLQSRHDINKSQGHLSSCYPTIMRRR